jgi:lipopolysaccharide export system permease protein
VKKIDKLLLKSFFGPFVVIFFVTLFILVMQFLWKYIDDLVGKGLPWYIILQLLFYQSASLVPLALPLAILLASIMTLGTLGEKYELTAFKSAGIPLVRIIRPLIITSLLLSVACFLFANYMMPIANLKGLSLLYDIRQKRPAVNIRPGEFYNGIDGYSIRVGSKDPDGKTIYNILIYDHTSGHGADDVLFAKKGIMTMTSDQRYLMMQLYDGKQYVENPTGRSMRNYEQARTNFKTWTKAFDLSAFQLSRTKEDLFKGNYEMQDLRQLKSYCDTSQMEMNTRLIVLRHSMSSYSLLLKTNFDSVWKKWNPQPAHVLPADTLKLFPLIANYSQAESFIRDQLNLIDLASKDISLSKIDYVSRRIEIQRKFTISFACFLLFLIGAPLGAIIRKGGLGLPFVISVFFFVFFYVLSITGERLAKNLTLSPFEGMWMSAFILMPIGIWLVFKASHDSILFNIEIYNKFFRRIMRWITGNKDQYAEPENRPEQE